MLKVVPRTFSRLLNTVGSKRPPFYEVFPQKKMVNRLLFELDSRLSFAKLYPVYENIYNTMDNPSSKEVATTNITALDMMTMKKVLEKVRHRTKSVNKNLLALENEILDRAAEMGDNDAISLLAYNVLKAPEKNTNEDVKYAKKLIKELYELKHPLTIKLAGDLALKKKDYTNAERYYKEFIALEDDTFLAGEVYQQLGIIYFGVPEVAKAEQSFLKSIKLCPIEFVVHSYFYLGQIYMNSEPLKARSLMEGAATEGFRESFKTLGFLEMHYFGELHKAMEWFKLGMELFEFECFIGYFDCSIKLKEWGKAKKCLKSMKLLADSNQVYESLFKEFVNSRSDRIKKLERYSTNIVADSQQLLKSAAYQAPTQENTWNL
ncbi:LAFE_0E09802g1_1 [Lachancea fermentati]|uniref:LAFE_0E09802g1_1 n=1 Tax=Lachancea fermentati TaxID=4955 RepID=A0A1G4MDF1_LACFM|nr:LAFE_0E09802g1_1 [Lachancea fermentati]